MSASAMTAMPFGSTLGDDLGPFQRIDGDIHLGAALADLLADIEHWRLVHLAFADDDGAGDGDAVEGMAHGLHRRAVGFVLVAAAGPLRGRDGGGLGDADEFERQVAVRMLRGLEGHGCPSSSHPWGGWGQPTAAAARFGTEAHETGNCLLIAIGDSIA